MGASHPYCGSYLDELASVCPTAGNLILIAFLLGTGRDKMPVLNNVTNRNPEFLVRVNKTHHEAEGILGFELVDPNGSDLPRFKAGAHIHVHFSEGLSRQYSLCNDPAERHRYLIAVLAENEHGRRVGALLETLKDGHEVMISGPSNYFSLADNADFHLLLAGGIGVTPMMAMIDELDRRGADYLMHYCTRSPEKTAFMQRLKPRIDKGKVVLHHDHGDPANGLNITATLSEHKTGTHLYACGPVGFLKAVNASIGAWPGDAVHQENYFV